MVLTKQKQDLLKRLQCGQIRSVINDVQGCLETENEDTLALFLLCGISNVITGGSVDLREGDIYHLCYMCCEALEVENLNVNKYKFLCSLYHITKYFVNQNNIDAALKLSSFILRTRCEVDEETICSVYYNCHYIFHRVVVAKKQEYLEGKADISFILNIVKHSLKFLKCCIGVYLLHVLDRATQFAHGVKLTDDEHHLQIVQLQIDILELTYCEESERCEKIGYDNLYKSYMSLLSSILKSLFDAKHLIEAQEVIRKTFKCISIWNKNDLVSKNCSVFLEDVLSLFLERPDDFAERLEACTRVLKCLLREYRGCKILDLTCITLVRVLHSVSSYWIAQDAEDWNRHMCLYVQKSFFQFIFCISKLLLRSQCVKCTLPSGKECPVNNDTVSSVNVLTIVVNCVMSSVGKKLKGFTSLLPDAITALNEAIEGIKTLKQANCPVWKETWKRCGIKTYNLGVHCNSAGLMLESKEFFSKFCQTCIQFGEQPESPEAKDGILGLGMLNLVQIYKDLKNYQGALRTAAVGLIILPNLKDKFLQQWAKIKNYASAEKYKNIQTLTIYDILKDDKKIEILYPNIGLESVNFPQLLIWELEAYSLLISSSWQCIQAAYNKLCSLSPNCSMQVEGLLAYLPSLWISGTTEEFSDVVCSVKNILETLKKENQSVEIGKERYLCLLGNLYYWLFLCQLRLMRLKQEEEVLSSNIIPTKFQSQQEDNHDPLETCDVTPAYRNLNLENESQILETLNEAVACWTSALQNGFIAASQGPLCYIEVAAHLYDLYGYVAWSLRSWCLYFKYAETLDNKEAMLLGLCHILEWCTCGRTECKLLTRAQDITSLLKLEDDKEFASQLLFHKYWLSRGRHCLRNKKFVEVGDCLEKLVAFTKRENIQHFTQSILYVQTALLICQCMCVPYPDIVTWPSKSDRDVMNEATRTYGNAMSLLKQVKMTPAENAQVLYLMLEVSQWLGQLCLELFWPREARCFMKGDLILSQKLGLATRTAQFLNLLAQVDVMCCNVNDSQVKLQGIEGLLQLESRFQPYDITSKNHNTDENSELSSQLERLTLERSVRIAEFRDISRLPLRNRSPCASPNLRKITFVLPSFVRHGADCKCNMCNTFALQALAMGAVFIQAEVYKIQSELKEALEFFEGGLQLYKQLIYKQHELIKKLSCKVHQLVLGQSDCTECFALLLHPLKLGNIRVTRGYADFIAASGSYVQAQKLNAEALREAENLKVSHLHLVADLMVQSFSIQQAQAYSLEPKRYKEDCTSHVQETPRRFVETIKTPLNTNSLPHHALLPLSISNVKNHHRSPYKIKLRKLVLPETKNDDSRKGNKQTVNRKSIQEKKNYALKQEQLKPLIVYEDSPIVAKTKKPPVSKSRVKQNSVRTLRSKTSQKETSTRHRVSEYESLNKVCQALEFTNDSPVRFSKIHQSSIKNRKKGDSSVNNVKGVTPNVTNDEGINLAHLGLQGLDVSLSDSDNEVFGISETVPALKQTGALNGKASTSEIFSDVDAPVLKASRPLRSYSKQNSKAQFTDKNKTSQEAVSEEERINSMKDISPVDNEKTIVARKQPCTSKKGVENIFPDSALTVRKTRGRGKSSSRYASSSVSSKISLKGNVNQALITDMENLVLDSENNSNDARKSSTKGKGYKGTKKGSQVLFTPSRKNSKKEHDLTIVSSSSLDELFDTYERQTNRQSKDKGYECKKKVIVSSASEDETSSKFETGISSDEEATLSRIKAKNVLSSTKKRRLPMRHHFLLN
ncbi:hypothetical protein L798_06435 [Zootermopsis nevadensis]|uniref:Separase n=1 Tax=Zootermopsis nevadensis TaxID=136037 RepID=A0A067RHR8_ZOONE|nr:hypothetical protein L798_06435 [Zootermopsis nevadensis]